MASPKTPRKHCVPCDFCTEQTAVLYCRADSAKLCLFCDQHVHSANLLSRKHVRSQICDNCGEEPVSVRCVTDNLVLCQECDLDAHGSCSVSASHDRNPIEGLSGCPSASELASIWGFDLEDKAIDNSEPLIDDLLMQIEPSCSWVFDKSNGCSGGGGGGGVGYQEFIVPNDKGVTSGNAGCGNMIMVSKRQQNLSCGKYKQVIYKQLVELFKRHLMSGDSGGGGEDLVPGTPSRSCWQRSNNIEGDDIGNINKGGAVITQHQLVQEQAALASLLTMPSLVDLKSSGRCVVSHGNNITWDSIASAHGTQIWDFNLGQLRNRDESDQFEVAYGGSDSGFMLKNFGELMKDTSLSNTNMLDDMCQINCPVAPDDMTMFNNNSNSLRANLEPAAYENNNLLGTRALSGLSFGKLKDAGGCKVVKLNEQKLLVTGDSVRTLIPSEADAELLAKNRGTAMQRYMEKKKTRRFDKRIRYESRKARADTRKRVKGRFVKASDAPDD